MVTRSLLPLPSKHGDLYYHLDDADSQEAMKALAEDTSEGEESTQETKTPTENAVAVLEEFIALGQENPVATDTGGGSQR